MCPLNPIHLNRFFQPHMPSPSTLKWWNGIRCRHQPENADLRWQIASNLDADTGLAPMPTFGVISVPPPTPHFSLVKQPLYPAWISKRSKTYRIVFPVRNRIHWGIGRFCFCAFASFCFVRKDLWDWTFIAINSSAFWYSFSLCCERGSPPILKLYRKENQGRWELTGIL